MLIDAEIGFYQRVLPPADAPMMAGAADNGDENQPVVAAGAPDVSWRGTWSTSEKQRIMDALAIVKQKLSSLIVDAISISEKLKPEDYEVVKNELLNYRKVLFGVQKFMTGQQKLIIHQQVLKPNTPRDIVEAKYWKGMIYLNTDPKVDWKRNSSDDLAALLFHEMTHHFGTEDDNSRGMMMNAHSLQFRFSSNQGLINSLLLRSCFPGKIPGYLNPTE